MFHKKKQFKKNICLNFDFEANSTAADGSFGEWLIK